MRKVNLGCGVYLQAGYINIDINPTAAPEIVRDVRKGLPFDDSSVDEVKATHFLEHLTLEEMVDLLEEIYRVLVPGGSLVVVVPIGDRWSFGHLQEFGPHSFDMLERPENAAYFQKTFRWKMTSKKVAPPAKSAPEHLAYESLRFSMEALK